MIKDEQLRQALEEYDEAILSALTAKKSRKYWFSPRFERKMRNVCRRAKHPVAYKLLIRAACVILAILALLGGTVSFHPEVRATVVEWISEQFGQFTHYYYPGESYEEDPSADQESPRYGFGWIPEGYVPYDVLTSPDSVVLVYVNESDCLLYLHCYEKGSAGPFINTKNYTKKAVFVGTHTADLFVAPKPDEGSAIVWSDPETGRLFCVGAILGEEDLIALAESVYEKN